MKLIQSTQTLAIFFILSVVVPGCSVKLIAPYDEITDKKVSDLQEKIAIKFKAWERKIPAIESDTAFYDQTTAVLEILISRNESIEKSERIVSMLKQVQSNIEMIRELHKKNNLTFAVVQEVKPDIMAQFNAIQKFQMALKNAERE